MRVRNIELVVYGTEEQIKGVIEEYETIKHYAYILHDKEEAENHFHILLNLSQANEVDHVAKWFKEITGQNAFGQQIKNKVKMFEYLTHDNCDKVSYSVDEIFSDDITFWRSPDVNAVEIVTDLLTGADYYSMMVKYGRDFIINFEKYKKFARTILTTRGESDIFITTDEESE